MNHPIRSARVDIRLALLGAVASLALAWAIGAAAVASAHTVATYYPYVWAADTGIIIGDVSSPLDTSAAKDSMEAGGGPWSAVSGSWLDFFVSIPRVEDPTVTWLGNACATAPEPTGVWLVTTDLSTNAAQADACLGTGDDAGVYVKGAIAFDDTPPGSWSWYTGSSSTVPSGKADLRSMSTHEFGHVTGFESHFGGEDCADPEASTDQTMCESMPTAVSWWRSLATHDLHTYDGAYN